VKKCPCLHISPRHAGVYSFIYIILEKIKYLSEDTLCTIFHAFITSQLSYCTCSLMYVFPNVQIYKLQHVQNTGVIYVLNMNVP